MNIASRGATRAVDWEQRVDFDRLRTHRLARAKAALDASDLGALLLFDPNNLRYVTSTAIGTWERDKNIRFALLPRGEDPILWDFGSAARHHQLYCPWLPEENWRAWVPPMRGAMPDATGVPDDLADLIFEELRQRGIEKEPLGIDVPDMTTFLALQPQGDPHGRLAAGDARGAEDQDRRRARAARPGGRDRRRGLRGDLPDAAPGRDRERDRRDGDEDAVRPRLGAGRGDQRHLRRPLQPASAHVLRPAAAAGRPGVLRHHPLVHGLPDVLLPHVQCRRRDARPSSTPTSSAASGSTTSIDGPARRHDRQDRRGLADREGARIRATSAPRSACSSGTASASASTSRR